MPNKNTLKTTDKHDESVDTKDGRDAKMTAETDTDVEAEIDENNIQVVKTVHETNAEQDILNEHPVEITPDSETETSC